MINVAILQEHRANVVLTLSAKFGTIYRLGDVEIDRMQIQIHT